MGDGRKSPKASEQTQEEESLPAIMVWEEWAIIHGANESFIFSFQYFTNLPSLIHVPWIDASTLSV